MTARFTLLCLVVRLLTPLPLFAQTALDSRTSLAALWQDLSADGEKAYASMRRLLATPKETLAFLRETEKPAAGVDGKVIEDLIQQLGSKRFFDREKAAEQIERLDRLALLPLKKA